MLENIMNKVSRGGDLDLIESHQLSLDIFAGKLKEKEIKDVLLSLKSKGECYLEIAGFVKTLKENALNYQPSSEKFFDIVGTGGDQLNTFNISTTCAFVLSACGVNIAKHGNRSVSSKCGSIDVLDELSIDTSIEKKLVEKQLDELGLSFIFAQNAHPIMKKVSALRKELATPTIFNLVGPLSNPINLTGQVLGVYKEELVDIMSLALSEIGVQNSAVIYGFGGMDEASLEGDNIIVFSKNGIRSRELINCNQFGIKNIENANIIGGNKEENAKILMSVLNNEESDYLEIVVFNCAIALYTFDFVKDIRSGIDVVRKTLSNKNSINKFQSLRNMGSESL